MRLRGCDPPEIAHADPVRSGEVRELRLGPGGPEALLGVPAGACGMVVFAHGSGSGRHSPRNGRVAAMLRRAGLATLLFDLLDADEAADRTKVFDIGLLGERLAGATAWLRRQRETGGLGVGYFGASTGAAAALVAAAAAPEVVRAVVARGGRPDAARAALGGVRAPTLLIVGSLDSHVLELNRAALAELTCPKALRVVEGAGHLFEEAGTLDQVTALARAWFVDHLSA